MKHHLTINDVQRIQAAAQKLPSMGSYVQREYTGADLLAMGIHTVNKMPVSPTMYYVVRTRKEVNLVALMVRLCEQEGMGVFDIAYDDLMRGNWHVDSRERIVFTTEEAHA